MSKPGLKGLFIGLSGLSLFATSACQFPIGKSDSGTGPTPEPTYTICGDSYPQSQFASFLNGNLVIVGTYSKQGAGSAQIIKDLILSMLLNGINFSDLASYQISFDNGVYSASNGTASLSFSLFFAEAYGQYQAGDAIPYNVFDLSSYITDIGVSVDWHGFQSSLSYSYNQGPLFGMIKGSVSLSGDSVSSIGASLSLQSGLIAFSVNSQHTYSAPAPEQQDTLLLDLTTPVTSITDLQSQFESGGFGLSYDGTTYNSAFFGIQQTFSNSLFTMTDGASGWFWQGTYQSTVVKGQTTFYQAGFASNQSANYTKYYCDEAMTEEIGVATDNLALTGGSFVFTDGTTFDYGLAPF